MWKTKSLKCTRQELPTKNIEEFEYPVKDCWIHHQKVEDSTQHLDLY